MIARVYPSGDLNLAARVWSTGAEYACQKIKQRLQFLRGEWCWNTSLGISYYRDILVKGPNMALIREIYVKEILDVPNIIAVTRLELQVDPASRLLSVSFDATYRDETGAAANVTGEV